MFAVYQIIRRMEEYGRKRPERKEWHNVSVHLPEDSKATQAAKRVAAQENISLGTALRRLLERLLG